MNPSLPLMKTLTRTPPREEKFQLHWVSYGMMKTLFIVIFSVFCLTWTQGRNEIRMSFHPNPRDLNNTLIWVNSTNYYIWAQQVEDYLEAYSTKGREENLVDCSYAEGPPRGKLCSLPENYFAPCHKSVLKYYGYKEGTPCIFLELDVKPDWKIKFYKTIKSLPKNSTEDLKDIVSKTHPNLRDTIWVTCEGLTPADKEFIGPVTVVPNSGFPGYLLRNSGSKGYLNPVVAVQFLKPVDGVVINIECKAWAPGIHHDHKRRVGVARFEILIDKYP